MKILILGSGAREYSIALALKNGNKNLEFYFAPGNGATSNLGTNLEFSDLENLASFSKENSIDLCIVGSEDFLEKGVVDIFQKHGIAIFGPSKRAAMLESSKAFMKDFLKRNKIRTAAFGIFTDIKQASDFIKSLTPPIVVKADGLCAGKGVIIAKSHDEAITVASDMLSGKSFAQAGKTVVIEEFLDGFELSIFALSDGDDFVILPATQDHKKLKDNDEGPNTGGMGAYAPSPLANDALLEEIKNDIIKPTLKAMKDEGNEFKGVLFAGLMIVNSKPYVLEFNVRFGDPECEVLMPLIDNPLDLFLACTQKKLKNFNLKLKKDFAVAVVCASKNYPFSSSPKAEISIKSLPKNSHISYAGVSKEKEKLFASGGRVLVCVALASELKEARDLAYELCENVSFDGMQFRKDIAYQALR